MAEKFTQHTGLVVPLDAANEANAPLDLFSSFFDDED